MDLIAESGGKWIFIGMESLDPANLADVKKSFNKPAEYARVLERLAQPNVYAITSFIFGLDHDTPASPSARSRRCELAAGAAGLRADHAVPRDASV